MKKVILMCGMILSFGTATPASAVVLLDAPSCAQWDPGKEVYRVWIEAYLSGIAMERHDNFLAKTDLNYIVQWVSNYCREHPKGEVAVAGVQLSLELMKQIRPASR